VSFGDLKKGKTSASDEWTTDPDLVEAIKAEFGPIVLDPAATAQNALAPLFITKEQNALLQDWNALCAEAGPGVIVVNPPYSKPNKPLFIGHSLATAQVAGGRTVVDIIPSNTRDRWFHRLVMKRMNGARAIATELGGRWPALLLHGKDTDLWLLEGQASFGSPLNPKGNGSPVGVAVVVFHGSWVAAASQEAA
jgi:phage N-6-adenine-methyltransferase